MRVAKSMQAQSGDMQCPSPHIASFSTTEEVYSIILERERQYNQTFLTCASFINGQFLVFLKDHMK